MKILHKEKTLADISLGNFIQELKNNDFKFRILNKDKIKNRYVKHSYDALIELLLKIRDNFEINAFSIVWREKEERNSWPSDYFLDGMVINLACGLNKEVIERTAERIQQTESVLREIQET